MSYSRLRQAATDLAAGAFWGMPNSFGVARMLGASYALRCVVFHHVSAAESPFTKGINVTITPGKLEAALRFLSEYYTPVRLDDVLAVSHAGDLPPRGVLVTFDDAYASVAEIAEPLCRQFGVPAVFFVNAAFLDNQRLAPDNLVCYVANLMGMEAIRKAAREVPRHDLPELNSLSDVFMRLFPQVSLRERNVFLDSLRHIAGIDDFAVAQEAGLYLSGKQLGELASRGFEIGNHTLTHVHCRSLSREDIRSQVEQNKLELEAISGTKIRSFSQPYGSSQDVSRELIEELQRTGHEAVFLSESVANRRGADPFHFDRVSVRADGDDTLFFEIEVLPRLRSVRNWMRSKLAFLAHAGTTSTPHARAQH